MVKKTGTKNRDIFRGTASTDTLSGLAGNDDLYGLGGNDKLDGGLGNDRLDGGAGADFMIGGAGNDTYIVDSTRDKIKELSGIDTVKSSVSLTLAAGLEHLALIGSRAINGIGNNYGNGISGNAAANVIDGKGGHDTLKGGAGNDTLIGGTGNDTLDGGIGSDKMRGNTGNDTYIVNSTLDRVFESKSQGTDLIRSAVTLTLFENVENLILTGTKSIDGDGNSSNNTIIGNTASNTLRGSSGNDTLRGGGGNDSLFGGEGSDILDGGSGGDFFDGGNGDDTVTYQGAKTGVEVSLSAQSGSIGDAKQDWLQNIEILIGSNQGDTLGGGGLYSIIFGGKGNDTYVGGFGVDWFVDATSDYFPGSTMTVYGGGDDTMTGGEGNDAAFGGVGADTFDGGAGHDVIYYAFSKAAVTVTLNGTVGIGGAAQGDKLTSVEEVVGSKFNDKLTAGFQAAELNGYDGADQLEGGVNSDDLDGGNGNDVISGQGGDDVIGGDAGSDVIHGGAGRDVLWGDGFGIAPAGDRFFYLSISESGVGAGVRDIIVDFQQGLDKIDLSQIDADGGVGDGAWHFNGTIPFGSFPGGEIIFVKEDNAGTVNDRTIIQGEIGGDGPGVVVDFEIELTGLFDLTAADFNL